MVNGGEFAEELASIDLSQKHLASGRLNDDADRTAHYEKHITACILVINKPLTNWNAAPGTARIQFLDGAR
jgi:hypothetical protein